MCNRLVDVRELITGLYEVYFKVQFLIKAVKITQTVAQVQLTKMIQNA